MKYIQHEFKEFCLNKFDEDGEKVYEFYRSLKTNQQTKQDKFMSIECDLVPSIRGYFNTLNSLMDSMWEDVGRRLAGVLCFSILTKICETKSSTFSFYISFMTSWIQSSMFKSSKSGETLGIYFEIFPLCYSVLQTLNLELLNFELLVLALPA